MSLYDVRFFAAVALSATADCLHGIGDLLGAAARRVVRR